MAFRSTPQLGPALDAIIKAGEVWFDIPGKGTIMSPQLGTKAWGSDGRVYVLVQAGDAIASNTQVAVSTAFVATAGGTSGFFTQVDAPVVEGGYFWARKGAL